MKKSKFIESQIIKALKENEGGRSVDSISRRLGIKRGTFYSLIGIFRGVRGTEVSHSNHSIIREQFICSFFCSEAYPPPSES